ncbi:MAG TPA: lytic transglycosylase domain-containing protein [Actinomycetes bacterium]|jgi:membrane-bound lytic murein transglycosylase B|nr:lytic transglycosylase domain-containing protein [Actinomycetes bacterium]
MHLPRLKLKVPRLPVPQLRAPRLRLPQLRLPWSSVKRYKTGALWALAILAALAALPSLVPGEGSELFAVGANGFTQQDEAAARHQAWLRGRAAAKEAAAQQAAAQRAARGPGAAPAVQQVPLPSEVDAVIPVLALRAYRTAESWAAGFDPTCMLPWSVLAGIGRIESNHGRHFGEMARFSPEGDVTPTILGPVLNGAAGTAAIRDSDSGRWDGDPVWDRAVGPMQFIPSTWRSLGRDGNGDGVANPSNLFDAAVSAAGYLCLNSNGPITDDANLRNAIFAYNHSWEYVSAVITWANFYQQRAGLGSLATVPVAVGPASSGVPASGTTGAGGLSTGAPAVAAGAPSSLTAPPTVSSSRPPTSRVAGSATTTAGSPSTTASPGTTGTTTTSPPPTTQPSTTQAPTTSSSTTTTTTTCPSTTTSSTSSTTTSTTSTTSTSSTSSTTSTTPPCAGQAGGT